MSDIEPTQALPLSDYDNETDDEQGDSERKPVIFTIIITGIRQKTGDNFAQGKNRGL